jgi:hypothetical protein
MDSSLAATAAPANTSLLKSKQVSPLPVGSGGNNPTKQLMNETNVKLTMLTAQANADTKYDPPVPKPVTKAVTKEGFTDSTSVISGLVVVGVLLIVYGIVKK